MDKNKNKNKKIKHKNDPEVIDFPEIKEFDKFDFMSDVGMYKFIESSIYLSLTDMQKSYKNYCDSIEIFACHVINHEFLHHLLSNEHNRETSKKFDSLTHGKQKTEKIWDYYLS